MSKYVAVLTNCCGSQKTSPDVEGRRADSSFSSFPGGESRFEECSKWDKKEVRGGGGGGGRNSGTENQHLICEGCEEGTADVPGENTGGKKDKTLNITLGSRQLRNSVMPTVSPFQSFKIRLFPFLISSSSSSPSILRQFVLVVFCIIQFKHNF
jgi:hypothetical protein